eukprot:TRINITY_DN5080_c0_g1::TRINITY_DN5080_c0_g1_i1::g.24836::m.24836 TRINITY_DN5080_c0_g1::TRINITY_DN5080_c0_g1_i1::g.24836  ORF type:complete len:516 (-),score=108.72,HET/PF06985.6/3.3e-09,HET/PF06985.6/4.4e+02 TRINITY_DN5080_c0_g1_i1:67-1614(-)
MENMQDLARELAEILKDGMEIPSDYAMVELTDATENDFTDLVGERILTLRKVSPDRVILAPTDFNPKLYAISHRWNVGLLSHPAQCVVVIPERKQCYHWTATVQPGCHEYLQKIFDYDQQAQIWMDQLCIPQKVEKFKNSQVSFMGKLYSVATTVISGSNCATTEFDSEGYLCRAWTQQEYSFGRVIVHPSVDFPSVDAKIRFLQRTLYLAQTIGEILDCAGTTMMKSYEMPRIHSFESYVQSERVPDAWATAVRDFWEFGWTFPSQEQILENLIRLREFCEWRGESLIGIQRTFIFMFKLHCQYPKDQLYGVFGVIYYNRTGGLLNYSDPEVAYRSILADMQWAKMIVERCDDGDATGLDGCLTPLRWRTNDFNNDKYPDRRFRDAKHWLHIPLDFPQVSQFGHHFKLKHDIEIWRFEREGEDWLAIGFIEDHENRIGKALFCVESSQVLTNRVREEEIVTAFLTILERNGLFTPDYPFNGRFPADVKALNVFNPDSDSARSYKVDENEPTWKI